MIISFWCFRVDFFCKAFIMKRAIGRGKWNRSLNNEYIMKKLVQYVQPWYGCLSNILEVMITKICYLNWIFYSQEKIPYGIERLKSHWISYLKACNSVHYPLSNNDLDLLCQFEEFIGRHFSVDFSSKGCAWVNSEKKTWKRKLLIFVLCISYCKVYWSPSVLCLSFSYICWSISFVSCPGSSIPDLVYL